MTENSSNLEPSSELTDAERARIRAETRYALLVAEQARPPQSPRSPLDKVLSYLSNGFVLLLLGSLVTSVLVPRFQRAYENRKQQASLMQECLTQFLLYSNSIWQEYYSILPLTQQPEIDKDEYIKYVKEIAQIKLRRYDAFAKVQALALVFRDVNSHDGTSVETALAKYAVRLNTASAAIDKWLTGLYCTPTKRANSPCASFDPTFDPYAEYTKIQELVVYIGNKDIEDVTSLIVKRINEH